jgi:glutamate-1-semialdehyde aminotransferase
MLAGKTLMTYLVEHEQEIYPRIARLGEEARRIAGKAFAEEGIYMRCTGYPAKVAGSGDAVLCGSSVAVPQFPYDEGCELIRPEDVNDPALCDVVLRDKVLQLALLLENVHVVHGGGSVSAAHTEADIAFFGEACRRVVRRIKACRVHVKNLTPQL